MDEIEFEVTSEDEVSLLYDFLEELLFYHETEFMLFSEFQVEIDENFHKAITFHKMAVKKTDHVEVQAIVDL